MWHLTVIVDQQPHLLSIPGLFAIGVVVGAIPGLFGAGGGFLLTPGLQILFGLPSPYAVGTSFGQVFLAGGIAARQHNRKQYVDLKLGLATGIPAILGTALGKHLLGRLAQAGTTELLGATFNRVDLVLYALFVGLMTTVMVGIVRETSRATAEEADGNRLTRRVQGIGLGPRLDFPRSGLTDFSLPLLPLIGFPVGVLCGMLGIGGGFINFPLLVYVVGVPTHIAVGTSALMTVLAGGYGAAANLADGKLLLPVLGVMMLGSLIGTRLGSHIAHRTGGKKLRKYFSAVLLVGILVIVGKVALQIWRAN